MRHAYTYSTGYRYSDANPHHHCVPYPRDQPQPHFDIHTADGGADLNPNPYSPRVYSYANTASANGGTDGLPHP